MSNERNSLPFDLDKSVHSLVENHALDMSVHRAKEAMMVGKIEGTDYVGRASEFMDSARFLKQSGVQIDLSSSLKPLHKEARTNFLTALREIIGTPLESLESYRHVARSLVRGLDGNNITDYMAGYAGADIKKALKSQKSEYKKSFDMLSRKQLGELFERFHAAGELGNFIAVCTTDQSIVPYSVTRSLTQWSSVNEARLKQSTDSLPPPSLPAIEDIEPAAPQNTISIVEVDELLPYGESAPMESDGTGEHSGPEGIAEVRTQPRVEWLMAGLEADGFEPRDMILYREKRVEGYNPQKSHYVVIEAQKEDQHFQIALNETIGNATYVIRKPIDFAEKNFVTVADLKADPAVFQVKCYTPEQWMRQLRHYAYRPLEDLDFQLKTKIFWGDKKLAVEESFGLLYGNIEQLPDANDATVFEEGPLAGKATVRRLAGALYRQSIRGLEHVKNFKDLRSHIFGETVPTMDAAYAKTAGKHSDRQIDAEPRKAIDVLRAFVHAAQQTGKIDITPDVNASFAQRKVSGLETLLSDEKAARIHSARDFLVATGAAREKSGKLVPARPEIIDQFARLLNFNS